MCNGNPCIYIHTWHKHTHGLDEDPEVRDALATPRSCNEDESPTAILMVAVMPKVHQVAINDPLGGDSGER